jgi:hypothetical protein
MEHCYHPAPVCLPEHMPRHLGARLHASSADDAPWTHRNKGAQEDLTWGIGYGESVDILHSSRTLAGTHLLLSHWQDKDQECGKAAGSVTLRGGTDCTQTTAHGQHDPGP